MAASPIGDGDQKIGFCYRESTNPSGAERYYNDSRFSGPKREIPVKLPVSGVNVAES
jgi:hypothetical protein